MNGQLGFPAKWPSICPRCDRIIRVGDRVMWANRRRTEVVHTACASGADDE